MKQFIYSALAAVSPSPTPTPPTPTPPTPTPPTPTPPTPTPPTPTPPTPTPPTPTETPTGDGNPTNDDIFDRADDDNKKDNGSGDCISATTCCTVETIKLYGRAEYVPNEVDAGKALLNDDDDGTSPAYLDSHLPILPPGTVDFDKFQAYAKSIWIDGGGTIEGDNYYKACSDAGSCGTHKLCIYVMQWWAFMTWEGKPYGQAQWCLAEDLCDGCDCEDVPDTLYVYIPPDTFGTAPDFLEFEDWTTLTRTTDPYGGTCADCWMSPDAWYAPLHGWHNGIMLSYQAHDWQLAVRPTASPSSGTCMAGYRSVDTHFPCEPWEKSLVWGRFQKDCSNCPSGAEQCDAEGWVVDDVGFEITATNPDPEE